MINTVNQAYAVANKEAEKVQRGATKKVQDATEIQTPGLEKKYNSKLQELTDQKNIALVRSNPLDRERIDEEYSKLIKQLKSDYLEQDKINQFNKTSANFTKNYGQFITAVNYQEKLKNAKSFSPDDLDNFKEAVGFKYFSNKKQEEINNIKTNIKQARAISEEFDPNEIANSLLTDANKMKKDLTAQLEYGSVKRYPEQESATRNQLANIENIIGILSSYGEQDQEKEVVENQESSTADSVQNNYTNEIINQLSSIIELLNKIEQINYEGLSDKKKANVDNTFKDNEKRKQEQQKAKEDEEKQKQQEEAGEQAKKRKRDSITSQKTQIKNQINSSLTRLSDDEITKILNKKSTILNNKTFSELEGIQFNRDNKQLSFNKTAFTEVGNLKEEYQELADVINKAAQKANVLKDTEYNVDESAKNKYDAMANSITKAVDLTSTMISLNSTLSNTIDDLANGDFSNFFW